MQKLQQHNTTQSTNNLQAKQHHSTTEQANYNRRRSYVQYQDKCNLQVIPQVKLLPIYSKHKGAKYPQASNTIICTKEETNKVHSLNKPAPKTKHSCTHQTRINIATTATTKSSKQINLQSQTAAQPATITKKYKTTGVKNTPTYITYTHKSSHFEKLNQTINNSNATYTRNHSRGNLNIMPMQTVQPHNLHPQWSIPKQTHNIQNQISTAQKVINCKLKYNTTTSIIAVNYVLIKPNQQHTRFTTTHPKYTLTKHVKAINTSNKITINTPQQSCNTPISNVQRVHNLQQHTANTPCVCTITPSNPSHEPQDNHIQNITTGNPNYGEIASTVINQKFTNVKCHTITASEHQSAPTPKQIKISMKHTHIETYQTKQHAVYAQSNLLERRNLNQIAHPKVIERSPCNPHQQIICSKPTNLIQPNTACKITASPQPTISAKGFINPQPPNNIDTNTSPTHQQITINQPAFTNQSKTYHKLTQLNLQRIQHLISNHKGNTTILHNPKLIRLYKYTQFLGILNPQNIAQHIYTYKIQQIAAYPLCILIPTIIHVHKDRFPSKEMQRSTKQLNMSKQASVLLQFAQPITIKSSTQLQSTKSINVHKHFQQTTIPEIHYIPHGNKHCSYQPNTHHTILANPLHITNHTGVSPTTQSLIIPATLQAQLKAVSRNISNKPMNLNLE
eukprot:gene2886-1868_t